MSDDEPILLLASWPPCSLPLPSPEELAKIAEAVAKLRAGDSSGWRFFGGYTRYEPR